MERKRPRSRVIPFSGQPDRLGADLRIFVCDDATTRTTIRTLRRQQSSREGLARPLSFPTCPIIGRHKHFEGLSSLALVLAETSSSRRISESLFIFSVVGLEWGCRPGLCCQVRGSE
jgi:hypothetical protein